MKDYELLGSQWLEAAKHLDIKCTSPFVLKSASGNEYIFSALLPEFGARCGTLLTTEYDKNAFDEAKKQGYTISTMQPETNLEIELESYKECLIDWGWVKHNDPPSWYV